MKGLSNCPTILKNSNLTIDRMTFTTNSNCPPVTFYFKHVIIISISSTTANYSMFKQSHYIGKLWESLMVYQTVEVSWRTRIWQFFFFSFRRRSNGSSFLFCCTQFTLYFKFTNRSCMCLFCVYRVAMWSIMRKSNGN